MDKWSGNPTPIAKYQTQRSYGTAYTQVRPPYSTSQFCIPVTNRFESLSVADKLFSDIQTESETF